jgi:hypothetical protein
MNKKLTKLHTQADRIFDKLMKAYKKKPSEKQESKVTKLTERSHDLHSQIIAVMDEERKEMDTRDKKWRTEMQHRQQAGAEADRQSSARSKKRLSGSTQQDETPAAKTAGKAKGAAPSQPATGKK